MTDGMRRPFDDVRAALRGQADRSGELGDEGGEQTPSVRLDLDRRRRTGIPEVVHAEHKSAETVAAALLRLAGREGRAVASRCSPEVARHVQESLGAEWSVEWQERARAIVLSRPGAPPRPTGGRIGIISAGTSDVPYAAEAALIAREMGVAAIEVHDVGVAGLHRLVAPLEEMVAAGVDAIIVAAGMDGALPSVVAGLVDVPVIGLPTPVGYGIGAQGVGALTTMLQSCAPGLAVVNVGNGIGAGSTAALIANRVAAARQAVEAGQ